MPAEKAAKTCNTCRYARLPAGESFPAERTWTAGGTWDVACYRFPLPVGVERNHTCGEFSVSPDPPLYDRRETR